MNDLSHPHHHHEPAHDSHSEPAAAAPEGTIYTCRADGTEENIPLTHVHASTPMQLS